MQDYKSPWNRNQYRLDDLEIRDSNPWATLASIVLIGILTVWALYALVQAIEVETEMQAAYYSKPDQPQAFRKQSPTHEQMWAMDHFVQVQEVMKAGANNGQD